MKYQYNYQNQEETVYYILGLVILISTFFITIKLLPVSLTFSLILLTIIAIISSIYIFNISKYSLYKYDILVYILIYYAFSLHAIIKVLELTETASEYAHLILISIAIILNIINFFIIVLKLSKIEYLKNTRIIAILTSYIFICFFIIIGFSSILAINANMSISKYINSNFKYDSY